MNWTQKRVVEWFDNRKDYDFIVHNEGDEIFVYFIAIGGDGFKSLDENQPVKLETMEGNRGLRIAYVEKIDN